MCKIFQNKNSCDKITAGKRSKLSSLLVILIAVDNDNAIHGSRCMVIFLDRVATECGYEDGGIGY